MLFADTKIKTGFGRSYREARVDSLVGATVVLTIDRENDPIPAPAQVMPASTAVPSVVVTFTGDARVVLPADCRVLVARDGYEYVAAKDLKLGDTPVPLGKWVPPYPPPPCRVVASVTPGQPSAACAIRVVGPRQNFAIGCGIFVAADAEA